MTILVVIHYFIIIIYYIDHSNPQSFSLKLRFFTKTIWIHFKDFKCLNLFILMNFLIFSSFPSTTFLLTEPFIFIILFHLFHFQF